MRSRYVRLFLGGTAAVVLSSAWLVGGRQDSELQSRKVADGIAYLVGPGGNVGVAFGADGVLLIDDKFEQFATDIEASIAALAPAKEIVWLVNTHWHGDHTGGNAHFAGKDATIVAHRNVRRRLAGDPSMAGRVQQDPVAAALPAVTHDDGMSLHFNGEEVRLLHFPSAHTDGDTVVWFTGSNVVHMGDLYFELGYPFIDTGSGGDVEGVLAGVERVLELVPEDATFISGHGKHTGAEGLREYRTMLATITERVRAGLAEGQRSAAQLIAAGVTEGFDERWGGFDFVPPEKFVAAVIESLRE